MTRRDRVDACALLVAGSLTVVLVLVFASRSCPGPTDHDPCPSATLNRIVVVLLAAAGAVLLVAPFAFVAEFAARRRIVYHGAWGRATRRAVIVGGILAALAALRLGGALSAPLALFVLTAPIALEVYVTRKEVSG